MNIKMSSITIILLASLFSPAYAVVVGDRDWMQVTDTAGYSWNNFDAIYDTSTGLCDVAECLLGGTLDVSEYRWASASEVVGLYQAYGAGDGTVPTDFGQNVGVILTPGAFDAMFEDFTATVSSTSFEQIAGYTRESALHSSGQIVATAPLAVRYIVNLNNNDDEYWLQAASMNYTSSNYGGWLYKTAVVPVPGSLFLLFTGLISLSLMVRRNIRG